MLPSRHFIFAHFCNEILHKECINKILTRIKTDTNDEKNQKYRKSENEKQLSYRARGNRSLSNFVRGKGKKEEGKEGRKTRKEKQLLERKFAHRFLNYKNILFDSSKNLIHFDSVFHFKSINCLLSVR